MDSALLGYQRKNSAAPVAVAYLLRVAGTCDLGAARAAVLDRARRFPALTHRLAPAAGRSGWPAWTPEPEFDVSAHVRVHHLSAAADEAELRNFVEWRCRAAIPLDAPPWEICLLPGPGADEFHVLFRASHIWLDGAALHQVLGMLFGEGHAAAPPRRGRDGQVTRRVLAVALGRLLGWATPAGSLEALARPWSRRHDLHWATTNAERLRALARAYDATVNDVFLVALAGALDSWSRPVGGRREVRALMPVSIRRKEEFGGLGNYVVGARVSLPRGPISPWSRFEAIRRQTSRYRGPENVAAGERWWFEKIPARFGPMAVTMGMDSRRVPVTTSNVGVLPGPMAVAGCPVTGGMPIPVLLPGQRLFVMLGVLGPTASLSVAVNGNVPDGDRLVSLWLAELDGLEQAAGLTAVPAQTPAPETSAAPTTPTTPAAPGTSTTATA
ncbi:wax ester/triacylglycerol synthase domain-containing protein [Pseudofrankia asymbiotica]|uniref:wax ester/triacylglycerol synthase domain-containing protein n=1 Tax=Pseudofrankia asymbiotica TaxID=1834516 RepID=UPI001F529078|nr:wax ester/triacylglycerol synthase domain-containing protein [Pseudofrankia asymbiotica]